MTVPPRLANAACRPVSLSCVLTNIYSNKVEVEVELSLEHKLLNVIGTATNMLQPAAQRNRSFKVRLQSENQFQKSLRIIKTIYLILLPFVL